jgi:hypothetical protein
MQIGQRVFEGIAAFGFHDSQSCKSSDYTGRREVTRELLVRRPVGSDARLGA